MHRTLLASLTLSALLGLAACAGSEGPGPEGGDDGSGGSSSPTPTDGGSPEDPAPSDLDDLGALVADDPTDLRWQYPRPPESWQQLETQEGIQQWQVGERCVLTLEQPAGLDAQPDLDSEQVLEDYAGRVADGIGSDLQTRRLRDVRVPLVVLDDEDTTGSVRMSRADLVSEEVRGEILAYRSGDFALILVTTCAADEFAAVDESDFQPFIEGVAAGAEY